MHFGAIRPNGGLFLKRKSLKYILLTEERRGTTKIAKGQHIKKENYKEKKKPANISQERKIVCLRAGSVLAEVVQTHLKAAILTLSLKQDLHLRGRQTLQVAGSTSSDPGFSDGRGLATASAF